MPPCRSIEKLSKMTTGKDLSTSCFVTDDTYLDLRFYFDDETLYKEIVQVRAYTFPTLIGNAGKRKIKTMKEANP